MRRIVRAARPKRSIPAVATAILALASMVAVPKRALALELTTDYPTIAVEVGQEVAFELEVTSTRRERVDLEIVEAPDKWKARLQGGGFEVGAVYTDPETMTPVELRVQVPPSAARGVHQVLVRGSSGRETRTLQLNLRVAEEVAGAFALTSEFPRLRGASDDTFQFDLTLTNNTARKASFNLLAEGPEGWNVQARPSTEQKATAATVEPDGEVTVQVEADPPDQVHAGDYPIVLRATGEGRTLEAKVVAEVIGSFDLTFSTADERLNASGPAGDTTSVPLVIRNEGTAPLNRVTLSATPPTDWEVSFEPKSVDHVAPRDAARVAARIKPAGDAVAGDYDITLTASGEGASESLDLRYAVETSTLLGVAGAAVIVITVGALLWVFRRFGRR